MDKIAKEISLAIDKYFPDVKIYSKDHKNIILKKRKKKMGLDTVYKYAWKYAYKNKYDYSEALYETSHKKIKIKCKKHGFFFQTPTVHLRSGCPECGKDITREKRRRILKNDKFFCTKCKEWKLEKEFHKTKFKISGIVAHCKKCKSINIMPLSRKFLVVPILTFFRLIFSLFSYLDLYFLQPTCFFYNLLRV